MALGHCGKVSDFVTYIRDVVGTPLAFEGNEATAHGIRTESKARCLYEMISQQCVCNGGFFPSEDRLLGASPDGQVHIRDPVTQAILVTYLLEIKSPMRALYDASKPAYAPFGIPPAYMCQMQGQMALSNTPWCDFFVFLERPETSCYCMRVYRSDAFWKWAEPKLRLVSLWIRDGLPSIVDRSFDFPDYEFASIRVEPFIPPFHIADQRCLLQRDPKRFPVFFKRDASGAPVEIGTLPPARHSVATAAADDMRRQAEDDLTPAYVSESTLQQWHGLFAVFCQGLQPLDVLQLHVLEDDEVSTMTPFVVETVDWDRGVVTGASGVCCGVALAEEIRRAERSGTALHHPNVLTFWQCATNGLRHARHAPQECTHAASLTPVTTVPVVSPKGTQSGSTRKRPRGGSAESPQTIGIAPEDCSQRSPSKPMTGSQPPAFTRTLHDALEAIALAIDCRGVLFAASSTSPLICLVNHDIRRASGEVLERRSLSDGAPGAYYWALFVNAAELTQFQCGADLTEASPRSADYKETLRRLFDPSEQSLVACVVDIGIRDDDLLDDVLALLTCPYAIVSVPAEVGWDGTVALLRHHFQPPAV